MFSRRRLDRMEALQQSISDQLATVVTALIVSEPRTGHAAEAFEGLRKSVNITARHRWQHLTQLLSFVDAIERGATIETLRERCDQWCLESGLQRYADVSAHPDWFDVVEGEGAVLEVVEPAWVDAVAGQVVKRGTARQVSQDESPPASNEPNDDADTGGPDSDAPPPADAPPSRDAAQASEAPGRSPDESHVSGRDEDRTESDQ